MTRVWSICWSASNNYRFKRCAFIESVKNGTNTPIDAYDTATWAAIAVLSAESIARNGAPVEIPDFTNGKWAQK